MTIAVAAAAGIPAQPQTIGTMKAAFRDVTLDASYPTGGYTLDPKVFGLTQILAAIFPSSSGYVPTYVRSTGKVIIRATGSANKAVLTELDNATDLHLITFFAIVFGY